MLEGIEILAQTEEILHTPAWVNNTMIALIITVFTCFGFGLASIIKEHLILTIISVIIMISGLTGMIIITCNNDYKESTGRYEYQVTIDDSVLFTEFHDKYEIIDQNGRIWTIRDKEK